MEDSFRQVRGMNRNWMPFSWEINLPHFRNSQLVTVTNNDIAAGKIKKDRKMYLFGEN